MSVYYNEFDPKAAAWLRELISAGLIPDGDVDERLADTAGGGLGIDGSTPGSAGHVDERGTAGGVGDAEQRGQRGRDQRGLGAPRKQVGEQEDGPGAANESGDGLQDAYSERLDNSQCIGRGEGRNDHPSHVGNQSPAAHESGTFWSAFDIIPCRDGKARRIPQFESVLFGMVDGVSGGLDTLRDSCGGQTEAEKEIIMDALKGFPLAGKVPGRVMLLKGSGNAIVPELAAEFIRAFMEIN